MAFLSLFQDGVSGVHKITRYNDEGLKHTENSVLSFPLKILKRRSTSVNFSLNNDGGAFNGTMYIPFAFSYKNTLRVKRRWEGLFFSLHTLCIEKSHPYLKICVRRTTAVRKVQYSDLFFRLHGIRHTLNCTQCTLSISYLNTQNWKVLLIFTVKRFVSVAKNVFPHACIFSSLFLKES